MKTKLLIPIVIAASSVLIFGTAYAAWMFNGHASTNKTAPVGVTSEWGFADPDFGRIDNVSNCSFLTATRETEILSNDSHEAVRLTNTAGTTTKTHSFDLATDRDYTVGEIKVMKIAFDYYHGQKREQAEKGLPKAALLYNGSAKGSSQGGGDYANSKSPFLVTNINENWWHLEFFITAMVPTMADYGDTPISETQKINGIRITDGYIYDYSGNEAFIVIDNVEFVSTTSSRLGLFNRTTDFSVDGYYWVKVAWSGVLNSCTFTFSDDTIAEHAPSENSPFYIHALTTGKVTVTATLDIGEEHQILSISNTLTVK